MESKEVRKTNKSPARLILLGLILFIMSMAFAFINFVVSLKLHVHQSFDIAKYMFFASIVCFTVGLISNLAAKNTPAKLEKIKPE